MPHLTFDTNTLGAHALLLMDHCRFQKSAEFINKLHYCGIEALYGPKGKTELWQPIDAGHVGACLKQLCKHEWDKWLDLSTLSPPEQNYNIWVRGGMSASEKRVVTTHVVGRAWNAWLDPKYDKMRMVAFVRSGETE